MARGLSPNQRIVLDHLEALDKPCERHSAMTAKYLQFGWQPPAFQAHESSYQDLQAYLRAQGVVIASGNFTRLMQGLERRGLVVMREGHVGLPAKVGPVRSAEIQRGPTPYTLREKEVRRLLVEFVAATLATGRLGPDRKVRRREFTRAAGEYIVEAHRDAAARGAVLGQGYRHNYTGVMATHVREWCAAGYIKPISVYYWRGYSPGLQFIPDSGAPWDASSPVDATAG